MKIEKEDMPLLDLILRQIEEEGNSDSTRVAEFDGYGDLKDYERMQKYMYLFEIVSHYCGGDFYYNKDNSGIIRTAHNSNGVSRLRKKGGFITVYQAQQRRKDWILIIKIIAVLGALGAIATIISQFL